MHLILYVRTFCLHVGMAIMIVYCGNERRVAYHLELNL